MNHSDISDVLEEDSIVTEELQDDVNFIDLSRKPIIMFEPSDGISRIGTITGYTETGRGRMYDVLHNGTLTRVPDFMIIGDISYPDSLEEGEKARSRIDVTSVYYGAFDRPLRSTANSVKAK